MSLPSPQPSPQRERGLLWPFDRSFDKLRTDRVLGESVLGECFGGASRRWQTLAAGIAPCAVSARKRAMVSPLSVSSAILDCMLP